MEFLFGVNQTDFLSTKQHSCYKQLSTTVIMETHTVIHIYRYTYKDYTVLKHCFPIAQGVK
jgi:hypothetical protein